MFEFKNLTVYKKAFALGMDIFEITTGFPKEEQYSLTSQIRRSSRSVYGNIAEAYRKRMYEAYFISKSSDADAENSETSAWVDTAFACKYINEEVKNNLTKKIEEIGRLLNHMIENPEKYLRSEDKVRMEL